jgi:peroxin-6
VRGRSLRICAVEGSLDPRSPTQQDTIFVAICPWAPLASIIGDIPWTISCVQKQDTSITQALDNDGSPPTIRFPTNSSCGQSIVNRLEILDPYRQISPCPDVAEVRVAKVRPLHLDTVYVAVENNLLENVDNVQERFGGGFNGGATDRGKSNASKIKSTTQGRWSTRGSSRDRLATVVREAIAVPRIVHTGDTLALPLPSHPITHIAPPPAIISACEPVTQGLISSSTQIILVQSESLLKKSTRRSSLKEPMQNVIDDCTEDTSNEQFYSATEDRDDGIDSEADTSSGQSDMDPSLQNDGDDISDDSLEDMISLHAPDLPSQPPGILSGARSATPRSGDRRCTGNHTPGSLGSSSPAATARAVTRPGKVYQVEGMMRKIPSAALQPKPNEEDDEQSFIFVDISTLTKIGCFSGDWVRLESCKRPHANGAMSFNLDSVGNHSEASPDWRAVRIFGLSRLAPPKQHYPFREMKTRTSLPSALIPVVYIPPVLLHNVGAPSFVKLTPLPKLRQNTPNISVKPPLAKEVTLRKVSTPMSTKKEVQSTLFTILKQHFQLTFRILKTGDLIAIAFDEEIGKATFSASQSAEHSGEDLVAARLSSESQGKRSKPTVAWFVVDQAIQEGKADANGHLGEEDQWGGIVMVDSSRSRMTHSGSNSVQDLPEPLASTTAIWLGLKDIPRGLSNSSAVLGWRGSNMQPYVLPLQRRLSYLISAATSPRALSLRSPPLAILLHSTQRQTGKSYIASSACEAAGRHIFTISAHDVLADGGSSIGGGDMKAEVSFRTRAERALSCGSQFTALLITHVEMLTADRMIPTLAEVISDLRVAIATTTELEKIPDAIRNLFTHELQVAAPNEIERQGILHNACLDQSLRLDPSVQLEAVALKTAALVAGDLIDVVHRASLAQHKRVENLAAVKGVFKSDVQYSGGAFVSSVTAADFNEAISCARSTFSDALGAPKIPSVTWKDVGGLADQKSSIMETISLPLTHPELFAKGMRKRSGILFYGPPGTGKTLLAKAIATEFSLNFFSVKGPELLNMYIGESEANVRRVFQRARDARPCVVFFDELDSVAPKRGNQGDSGGVMDRIVSQLLAEMDGMSSGGSTDMDSDGGASGNAGGIFVIGATNRPDLLDPALLRPGRFDKMLYLGVSSTHEQQVTILEALTRKFNLDAGVDLGRVASRLPFRYTGADLYALCSDAMLKAITKKTTQVDFRVQQASRARGAEISTAYYFDHLATPDDTMVVVGEEDFAAAQKEVVASVR